MHGCLATMTLAPFATGVATAWAPGMTGWILFALLALPLAAFAFFSEGMRSFAGTKQIDGYWGLLPIAGFVTGRLVGLGIH